VPRGYGDCDAVFQPVSDLRQQFRELFVVCSDDIRRVHVLAEGQQVILALLCMFSALQFVQHPEHLLLFGDGEVRQSLDEGLEFGGGQGEHVSPGPRPPAGRRERQ